MGHHDPRLAEGTFNEEEAGTEGLCFHADRLTTPQGNLSGRGNKNIEELNVCNE